MAAIVFPGMRNGIKWGVKGVGWYDSSSGSIFKPFEGGEGFLEAAEVTDGRDAIGGGGIPEGAAGGELGARGAGGGKGMRGRAGAGFELRDKEEEFTVENR